MKSTTTIDNSGRPAVAFSRSGYYWRGCLAVLLTVGHRWKPDVAISRAGVPSVKASKVGGRRRG